jgi:phosphopantetheine adenylyltransferase
MANRAVGNVETVFIMTGDQHALTSSSLIRQIFALGGELKQLHGLMPELVIRRLRQKKRDIARQGPPPPDAPAN